jgi:hypothetical protein
LVSVANFRPGQSAQSRGTIRYNEWEMVTVMSRRPIGDRAMTSGERQRRYLAKLAKPAAAPFDQGSGGLIVQVEHLRLYPDGTAMWLHRQLGRGAAVALRDALGRAIEAAAEGPPPPGAP